jgi:hypothetical protein
LIHRPPRILSAVSLFALVLCSAAATAQTSSFSDGEFLPTNWSDVMIVGDATDAFTTSTVGSGGSPGAYRLTMHLVGFGTLIRVAHVNMTASYAPATQGAITGIDFSFAADHFTAGAFRYTLLVLQNSTYYATNAFDDAVSNAWVVFQHQGFTAAGFTKIAGSGPAQPDFSTGGSPIQLGYMTHNSDPHSPPGAYAAVSGIDNWSVQIHSAPLPPHAFITVAPCRVLDTRAAAGPLGGPALQPGETRVFIVTGICAVPGGATALAGNLTAVQPTAAGELRLLAGDSGVPLLGTVSFAAGQTRSNNALVSLALDGSGGLRIYNVSAGSTHVVLDVNGYFQ